MSVAIKIPTPPQPKGNVVQDIRSLYTYLFQVAEILNKNSERSEAEKDVRKITGG